LSKLQILFAVKVSGVGGKCLWVCSGCLHQIASGNHGKCDKCFIFHRGVNVTQTLPRFR